MTITVGINGFGRIGRATLAHVSESLRNDIKVVKVNATGPIETAAHLMRYDSVHGRFPHPITVEGNTMDLGRGPIEMFSTYDMTALDWDGVDVVMECTGKFNDGLTARTHLERGARKVLLSAPGKNVDRTVVYGVNHDMLQAGERMISNGSCTTNCLAPLAKVLHEGIGIESGIMTTIHAYTGDQPTLDRRHSDLYRARAAASRSVKSPVHSSTMSISDQSSASGSRSALTRIGPRPASMVSPATVIVPGKRPCTLSNSSRWALVSTGPRSLIAAMRISSRPDSASARSTLRPIRPNPLMASVSAMIVPPGCDSANNRTRT